MLQDIPTFKWARILKVRRLVHGHRDCHWHPYSKLHMPGWGQIMQPHLHAYPWGHPNRKVLSMKLRTSLDWNSAVQTSTLILHASWKYDKRYNETLTAYIYPFRTAAKQCAFDNDTAAICIFVKGLRGAPTIASKYMRTPKLLLSHQTCWETQWSTPTNS